ncbi:hypothetical protein FHL15_010162 [Xylaria flabelliformis]|uniref:Nucleoporin NUP53 n=1 Tax=Xylaria flabelliformis TaxID=2512241 RepID=A0A553HLU5_9PEZI|nr:hypothetical protein FHL15_010162 [Xylaria flabelliformis]
MPPLILHNVPDEELYTGEDGIQRPYAMIWPENDRQRNVPRTRAREINETGSFGKSTRRSRSRTGSAPPKREDATMQSADRVFGNYLAKLAENNAEPSQRKTRQDEPKPANSVKPPHREPVEVILRGYASPSQQYAAINHYEQLAGRICEDYSREPPIEARRYKSELRDAALTRRQPLTRAEREKVNKIAGGEHWIKVTFESQEAASAALYASPQRILGHLVYAEPYRSLPPMENAAILDVVGDVGMFEENPRSNSFQDPPRRSSQPHRRNSSKSFQSNTTDRINRAGTNPGAWPSGSQASGESVGSTTVSASSATISTATVTGSEPRLEEKKEPEPEAIPATRSRRIPSARKITLLPAEAALRKSPTWSESVLAFIPLLGWFSGAMIGSEVPRNDAGEFDMNRASLYWKIMYWLDYWFRLFGHELVSGDKED